MNWVNPRSSLENVAWMKQIFKILRRYGQRPERFKIGSRKSPLSYPTTTRLGFILISKPKLWMFNKKTGTKWCLCRTRTLRRPSKHIKTRNQSWNSMQSQFKTRWLIRCQMKSLSRSSQRVYVVMTCIPISVIRSCIRETRFANVSS